MLAIPFIIAIYYIFPESAQWRDVLAAGVFVLAAVTDWFDGFLARKLNQMSAFGAFLDPVADKLLVCASLLVLLDLSRVNAFIVLIIIGREIGVSALREWMARIGASSSVAVHMVGKVKTAVQMVAIPFLLLNRAYFGIDTAWWGTVFIYVAALLTIISMVYYMRKALPEISKLMKESS